ncbi:MAG: DapH/DapD/GlmU-related protein [Pseudomonadales bacterium]|jgi:2,3,4,5-tetrahydropyridine-2-carboxylate N-succinyltransferase
MSEIYAFGVGLASTDATGGVLECFFPAPLKHPDAAETSLIRECFAPGTATASSRDVEAFLGRTSAAGQDLVRGLLETDRPLTSVRLDLDGPIGSVPEAYLKLHLLSHRMALPNSQNLDGIFAHLPNVAWTSDGPLAVSELAHAMIAARAAARPLEVFSVDKFPKMTNYVVPPGVRIADASRVRLGAYLGDGTTVMPEGQINFNAGALGPSMVEGRISQGVIIGAHSDLGGGASTMGTLSGGGEIVISIGEHCLIGANGGTGIPLGDRCTIAAGVYITAGTPVIVLDEDGREVSRVKARQLAGGSDMLFIQNGANGRIECRTNRKAIALNEQLHAHN